MSEVKELTPSPAGTAGRAGAADELAEAAAAGRGPRTSLMEKSLTTGQARSVTATAVRH